MTKEKFRQIYGCDPDNRMMSWVKANSAERFKPAQAREEIAEHEKEVGPILTPYDLIVKRGFKK